VSAASTYLAMPSSSSASTRNRRISGSAGSCSLIHTTKPKTRRVRPLLLVLLWIWAGCVALVLDLFWNVAEFDGVRPRASLYRGVRAVAHGMVGEPLYEEVLPTGPRAARTEPKPLATRGDARLLARPVSRHPGGRPDAATPQGQELLSGLVAAAGSAQDPAKRRAAVRSLAAMFGPDAHGALSGIAEDPAQPDDVGDLASTLLARSSSSG